MTWVFFLSSPITMDITECPQMPGTLAAQLSGRSKGFGKRSTWYVTFGNVPAMLTHPSHRDSQVYLTVNVRVP